MERDEIRLECLKVASTKTSDHQVVLATAKDYVDFVMEKEASKAQESKGVVGTKKPTK